MQEDFHSATFALDGVANTVAVTIRVLAPTQTTDLTVSPGARESSIAAPVDGTLMEKPTHEAIVAQDPITISALDVSVVTSKMRQLMIQLALVILGGAVHQ